MEDEGSRNVAFRRTTTNEVGIDAFKMAGLVYCLKERIKDWIIRLTVTK